MRSAAIRAEGNHLWHRKNAQEHEPNQDPYCAQERNPLVAEHISAGNLRLPLVVLSDLA